MAALSTIPDTIELGDISIYLSGNEESQGGLYTRRLSDPSMTTIAAITDTLRWQYEGNPSNETLRGVANYALWGFGKYGLQAKYIQGGSGGGSVIPVGGVGYAYTTLNTTIDADGITFQNNALILGKDFGSILIDGQEYQLNIHFTVNMGTYSSDGVLTFINGVQVFAGSPISIPYNKKL